MLNITILEDLQISDRLSSNKPITDQFLNIDNFQQAWLKVSAKKGCAGIDNQTIEDFGQNLTNNLTSLINSIVQNNYFPSPCKQVFIPKKQGELRELKIPTIKDRIIQHALLNILVPLFEPSFSSVSYAYRPNLSYINAVEKVAQWRDMGYHFVLDADLVKFFDNINHQRLLTEVKKVVNSANIVNLIEAWITVGIATKNGSIKSNKGIPQGAVISPLLANIYLNEFDRILNRSDLKLVRYADDFVVLANSQERIIKAYYQIEQILREDFQLELHEDKSQVTNFEYGFRFLGHGFLGDAIFPLEDKKKKGKKKSLSPEITTRKQEEKEITKTEIEIETDDLELEGFQEQLNNTLVDDRQPNLISTAINSDLNEQYNQLLNKYWNQEMATLYLMEQGTTLSKNHLRFIIQVDDNKKIQLPVNDVERIILFGNIHLTTPVMNSCLKNKVMLVFLNQAGHYKGHLWSGENISLNSYLTQFDRRHDKIFQFNISRSIVYGKLFNSKQLLLRLNRKRKNPQVSEIITGINRDLDALEIVDNVDSLRGYEGVSAARYFPALGQLITNNDPTFNFNLRTRQPPKDAVNSLLSFGYTLLFNNVLSLIIAEGLSPYLANFHYGEEKKPYLAFDLMEEFRSIIVDSLVIKIVNNGSLKSEDFEKVVSHGGIYLSEKGRRLFLKQFENRMNETTSHSAQQSSVTYRQAIQLQVRAYKRSLQSNEPYQPYLRTA